MLIELDSGWTACADRRVGTDPPTEGIAGIVCSVDISSPKPKMLAAWGGNFAVAVAPFLKSTSSTVWYVL